MANNNHTTIMKKSILVVITGQLRNAIDNIPNWIEQFKNTDLEPHFLFYVWNERGNVDKNKLHLRCLRTRRTNTLLHTEISANGHYYIKGGNVMDDLEIIKSEIPFKCDYHIVDYDNSYMEKAGELEINDVLKKDTHPWWQGSIPVAYINHLAKSHIERNLDKYNFYCRLQSEATLENIDIDWSEIRDNTVITSPNTINPKTQVSIKFYLATLQPFLQLMDAYTPSIQAFKNYKEGTIAELRPIGERFLKRICINHGYNVKYSVTTNIVREKAIPQYPILVDPTELKELWTTPTLEAIFSDEYYAKLSQLKDINHRA